MLPSSTGNWFHACRPATLRAGACCRGFTLLELLTVLTIIAGLAGIVVGVGRRVVETGRVARAKAELAVLAAALEDFRRDEGDFPRTANPAQLLQCLLGRRGPRDEPMAGRSLLDIARFATLAGADPLVDAAAVLVDPWDGPYRYAYKSQEPWRNSGYVLYSAGPDRRDSGALLPGGLIDSAPPENADNIYADR
jgi:prepilin-type N-terminal cleavage/methylation domain-containing protein